MEFKYDIYLAAPFFNEKEREAVERVAMAMRKLYNVYVPMEHSIDNAWDMSNYRWGRCVFEEDIRAIDNSRIVAVLDWGHYADAGTAWECGYAYGKGKQVHRIRMDRDCIYSLMMEFGCHFKGWENIELDDFLPEVKQAKAYFILQ